MAFSVGLLGQKTPCQPSTRPPTHQLDEYDNESCSSTSADSVDTARTTSPPQPQPPQPRSRSSFLTSTSGTRYSISSSPRSNFLLPPSLTHTRSSTTTSTPIPSRSGSPLPHFFSSGPPSSCTSSTDSEPDSPLLRTHRSEWREERRTWWAIGTTIHRRRRRDSVVARTCRRWSRRIIRHPLFPRQPITIIFTLLLLSIFAIFLTLLLIHILNPDKTPLPWQAYCSVPSTSAPPDYFLSSPTSSYTYPIPSTMMAPFPPNNLDDLPPAGLFIGVFSTDSAFERRMLVRSTWATHPRSRDGAGEGDGGVGTSRSVVRFILGQPRKAWERRIELEMEMYNDIIILPVPEKMNAGKTHTFFSWASINAWVPPLYVDTPMPLPQFSYANYTASPPPLAPHDPSHAWQDRHTGRPKPWVRPDYVVKVDDDSFVMLAELESRLRLELHVKPRRHHYRHERNNETTSRIPDDKTNHNSNSNHNSSVDVISSTQDLTPYPTRSVPWTNTRHDPLVYWGYLVKNRFMAGELYALSWSLVDWVAKDPAVKGMTKGAEDKQTAKWMAVHPRAEDVRWTSERCWIYDHPRSGTVYAHGFLFPSEVTRVKRSLVTMLDDAPQAVFTRPETSSEKGNPPTPSAWAHSTVSTFGVRYTPPISDLTTSESVEALVEGSEMSMIREGSPMTPEYAWIHREGRKKRYEGNRVGGTVVVHFIKKNFWFLETALALLEGDELSESEKFQRHEWDLAGSDSPTEDSTPLQHAISQHRHR